MRYICVIRQEQVALTYAVNRWVRVSHLSSEAKKKPALLGGFLVL